MNLEHASSASDPRSPAQQTCGGGRASPVMRARLAESAFDLFGLRGFDAVTIDEIAAHCGVTKGSFYSHYHSKDEIVAAACAHYYRAYQRRVHAEISSLTDPLERLERVLELSVRTCVLDDINRVFTTEIFARALHDDELRKGWAQFYDTVREMYVGLLLAVHASGDGEVEDPRRAVDLMLAAIEGVKMRAALESHLSGKDERRAIVGDLLWILTGGGQALRTPGSRAT
ncbi:MAG: TetR/AcrR family transcriptional regulator [bacterium]|nr:TetR/AcrR family transcriptional regulator [bacterium]